MTYKEIFEQSHRGMDEFEIYELMRQTCPHLCGYCKDKPEYCGVYRNSQACDECWNREADDVQTVSKPTIKDSGARREFETGAVRDIQEGKGRCDLLPLDVLSDWFTTDGKPDEIFKYLYEYQISGLTKPLDYALMWFSEVSWKNNRTMMLEVSKHFEEGAKKYGEYNWQKGIPTHCYIDSAVRHYLKYLRGDQDERHDRAFVWNILCCIWTCKHKPELNDYAIKGER